MVWIIRGCAAGRRRKPVVNALLSAAAHCLAVFTAILISATAAIGSQNALESAASPYLRLHSSDAVEWRLWSDSAFEEARQSGRPVFLSIGYLACHWCHVMQRESFKDPKTADILNTRFIPVLVDREQRPEIDELYQELASRLGLPTGWPLNLVLTADGHPFFGGVYFPPEPRAGVLAFRDILTRVEELYREDPVAIADVARGAIDQLMLDTTMPSSSAMPSRKEIEAAVNQIAGEIDDFSGGFGNGAKFPRFPALRAIWRGYLRSGDKELASAVFISVKAMANGAMADQVGGGFFRYTVDPLWRQPHFEKMLDVNAMAIAEMTDIWRETGDADLANAVAGTVQFLLDEMRLPGGAFATALDADSEDREGAFYVWDSEQLQTVLGPDAALFSEAYALAEQEEGVDGLALYRSDVSVEQIAGQSGLPVAAVRKRLSTAIERLKAHRANRVRPARDEKIIAAWNGLAASALVEAGMAFDRPDWVSAGRQAFQATLDAVSAGSILHHASFDGRPSGQATLEDRGFLARAALDLFMAEGAEADLAVAQDLIGSVADYEDQSNGGYFMSATPPAKGLPRLRTARDTAAPSGNAVLGDVFAALYYITGEKRFRRSADRLVMAFSRTALAGPLGQAGILATADHLNDAVQIVVVAEDRDPNLTPLLSAAWQVAAPGRVLQVIAPGTPLPDGHPAQYKDRIDNKATAYVCVGQNCSLPNTEPARIGDTIREYRRTWN